MIVLANLTLIISALLLISHKTEKANLSTPDIREHNSSVNNFGSISVRRSTKYTVVHLLAASRSNADSGFTKYDTSAIWQPT